MADERRYALQLRIGTFILVSLVVFFAIVYLLGARARYFESKYEIAAEFTEVAGLIEGATVRLAGVQIGRVTGVRLPPEPGGRVRVDLTIEPNPTLQARFSRPPPGPSSRGRLR